jgi:hypothetical protein
MPHSGGAPRLRTAERWAAREKDNGDCDQDNGGGGCGPGDVVQREGGTIGGGGVQSRHHHCYDSAHRLSKQERRQRQLANVLGVLRQAMQHSRKLYGRTVHDWGEVFSTIDQGGTGQVSYEQLKQAMRRLGLGLSDSQVRAPPGPHALSHRPQPSRSPR